jgi:hypothetical protein
MKRSNLLAGLAGAAVATAIAGGVAWASIPEGGVIQGCYDAGGNLKVVAALPCPKGYTSLPWNQQGIQGQKGDKGDKGDQGPRGSRERTAPTGRMAPTVSASPARP